MAEDIPTFRQYFAQRYPDIGGASTPFGDSGERVDKAVVRQMDVAADYMDMLRQRLIDREQANG